MPRPSDLTFHPPSPGAWGLERTHLTRPVSRFVAGIYPGAMMRGFAEGTRLYGVLLDHLEVAVLHQFVYMAPRPVGAPKGAKGPPPKPVFALLRRLHPEIRRRVRRAGEVFRDRTWREDVALWDGEIKPDTIRRAHALAQEDLSNASGGQIAAHVRRAAEFMDLTMYRHHRFNTCVMVPLGDFLNHATDWTGLSPAAILQAFRGCSPASAGATGEIAALRQAVRADDGARTLLESSDPPAGILDALQSWPDPAGAAARAYVETVGLRVLGGYDVADPHAREHPDLLLRILRAAVDGGAAPTDRTAPALSAIRDRVPSARRDAFDELFREAELTYRIRDERIFYGDALGVGLARRAILEAGRWLCARGLAERPDHLVDATVQEIAALLEGGEGPLAAELSARHRYRTGTSMDVAPVALGLPPSPPPPAEWLPPAAARLQRAVDTMLTLLFAAKEDAVQGRILKGLAASPGVYEGPARVVLNVEELSQVTAGDILVAPTTGPTFNVVLPLLGAIVTERGGALSHAAIVAREYGIPGVVGCVGAARAVATGARLRVDGGKGEVCLLD